MAQAHFEGDVRTLWLVEGAIGDDGPDRRMQLLEDFAFVDPNGVRWLAPASAKIDGASIPQALWSLAGDPYSGTYRRASVLHDVACVERKFASKYVHRMFYDAMVCDGTSKAQAVEFYLAVRLGGDSWDGPAPTPAAAALSPKGPRPKSKRRRLSFNQVEKALDAALGE